MLISAAAIQYRGRNAVLLVNRDITEHKLAEIQLDLHARRLTALSRMGQIVTSSLNLDEVLQLVTGEVRSLVSADQVSVLLLEGPDSLKFAAISGA